MATFMTAEQLGIRLNYSKRHINEYLKDRVFFEGTHYVRLPSSRRILYVWDVIEREMLSARSMEIPMANGGICHG